MTQKTNLNISPYYDDFDPNDQFYKVLFKPGFPVQARELTTLQSGLQNQLESFGSHIFKDGSMVIPGGISFNDNYYSIKIEENHLGTPVSLYLNELKGLRLKGSITGVILSIDDFLYPEDNSDITDLTIFVNYFDAGSDNLALGLQDGENLIVEETFTYGNTVVTAGESVLSLIENEASFRGSSVSIEQGVYFIRGQFVDVNTDKIVLDPYDSFPSYRVGLNIDEQLITAKDDGSLYDNARGFSNFAAPGADRLRIKTQLSKKGLTDYNDTNFIELLRVDDGEIKIQVENSDYAILRDYFAKRTYEESGNYAVDKFDVQINNSLDDGIGVEGIYKAYEVTEENNIPSDDLMIVKVSAGTAYVHGYDINLTGTTNIDVDKPRDTREIESALVPYEMGTVFKVNNVFGVPSPNINLDTPLIELYNKRTNSNTAGTGDKIGQARVYSFAVSDASYANDTTQWDLRLFDVQIFTKIELNQNVTNTEVPLTSFVRGVSSGATGYVSIVSGGYGCIHLSEITGRFMAGEQLIINEDTSFIRSIKSIKSFGIQDVKSVYQDTSSVSGYVTDFVADAVLQRVIAPNFSNSDLITITGAGATTNGAYNFVGVSTGTILRYTPDGETVERFNRIESVSGDGLSVTLSAVPSISGICNGALNSSKISTNFAFGVPKISASDNRGLFAKLDNDNISDINLSSSTLLVGKNITGESTDGSGVLTFDLSASGISSAFYESFDEERYSIHYSDGAIESLTSDQFVLSTDGQSVTINGLRTSQTLVVVSTTLKKESLKSKQKEYIRSEKKTVENTAVGINTALTGMTVSKDYGLRVEDREISLNVPDAVKIIGIFESTNALAPTLDKLTFPSGLSLDTESILGEKIYGEDTGAVAQITSRLSSTELEIVNITSTDFAIGETMIFSESAIQTSLQDITFGNHINITNEFILDKGQREQFYDYSRIIRKSNFTAPSRKLLIVFDKYQVPSNDTGDFYTIDSYTEERYSTDIPIIDSGVRASDTIDFRPRVSDFSGSGSPFAFSNRTFSNNINPSFIVTPNESSIVGYDHYLPRIDRVVLDTLGRLNVIQGISNIDPKPPADIENGMNIATIQLPPYLYHPDDAKITIEDNVRFTMKDIGKLEDRIANLETTTSLSLLELDTKTLQIQDADGLSRFKTGFFVDDFKGVSLIDIGDDDCDCAVDTDTNTLEVPKYFWSIKPELALDPTINSDTADFSANLELLDENVRKTGDLITLNYEEVSFINQPLASRVNNVNPFHITSFFGEIKLDPQSDQWVRNVEIDGGTKTVTGSVTRTYVEKIKVSSVPDTHIRSRNVSFEAIALRPVTRHYPFFDKTANLDFVPKLIEITMTNGIFTKGENVEVFDGSKKLGIFRLAQPNHKKGDYNSPSEVYNANPYDTSLTLGTAYSASSTVLNIDINSLADEAKGSFYGYVKTGFTILGQTSKAQATVSNHRLVADTFGDLFGSFFFRDPLTSPPPPLRFKTGKGVFTLTSSSINAEQIPGELNISVSEEGYNTGGTVNTTKSTVVNVRQPEPLYYYNGGGGGGGKGKTLFGGYFMSGQRIPGTNRFTNTGFTSGLTMSQAAQLTRVAKGTYGTNIPSGPGVTGATIGGGNAGASGYTGGAGFTKTKYGTINNVTGKYTRDVGLRTAQAMRAANREAAKIRAKNAAKARIAKKKKGKDPLAQTFRIFETGAFITSVDLFFAKKDPNVKLIVELRTTDLATPTDVLLQDYATVTLNPNDIEVSNNAEVPTRVTFPSPVYVEPSKDYAIVLRAETSVNYEVWCAKMGEKTVNTQSLPDAESVIVTRQYVGGSLFKSQNGSLWSPSQNEDLKFNLYRADFAIDSPGTAFFYNSPLDIDSQNIRRLLPNSIKTLPRKLKVGITTTSDTDSLLLNGVKVSDSTSSTAIHGYIENIGGPVGVLTVTNAGEGFPTSQIFTQVPLFNITGNGSGMTARIETNSSGQIVTANITSNTGGAGYVVGDVLGITTSNVTKGRNAQITVQTITGKSTLYLKNVQGEEFTTGDALVVDNGSSQVSLATTTILSSATYDDKYTGNIIEVSHYNHAMEADNNFVTIADVEPDSIAVLLTNSLSLDDQVISVASTSEFSTFSGISTTQGYIKLNNEIIYYDSIGVNQLGIGTRGVDGTIPRTHQIDDRIFKYELNGFDLREINKTHDMLQTPVALSDLKDMDTYYLSLNRGSLASGDSQVSFNDEANLGGSNIFASQNYQFDMVAPQFSALVPNENTRLTTNIRTVSGTSAGGNEVSFIDQGFENIILNEENNLSSPRLLASRVNEVNRLTDLPLNRSVTLGITFESIESNISPVIDTQNGVIIYSRSRINKPIFDYVKDGRAKRPIGDPHSAVYISNPVNLKNAATSLKVLLTASRHASADFRVLYQLIREDASESELSYKLFPGFDNLKDTTGDGFGDQVIDESKNSGLPDAFVLPNLNNEFSEYQFSVDNLEEFIGYRIKIVMSGTNEAKAPSFKDLRTIALA